MKRALKWLLIACAVVCLLLLLGFITFPLWFGSVLHRAAPRFESSFSNYERVKGGRFAVTDLVRTNELFDIRVRRIEGYLPYTWWRTAKGTNHDQPFLQADGWRVVIHNPAEQQSAGKTSTNLLSIYDLWQKTEHYLALGRQWLPKATLLNGTVEYAGRAYTFPVITWDEGKLDASGVWPISGVPLELKGRLTGELPYQLYYTMPSLDLSARLRIIETNQLLNTKLLITYKENRANLDANFPRKGVFPLTANLNAPDLKISGSLVHLNDYNEFTGSLSGYWRTNHYELQLQAHADPISRSSLPPADIQLTASGDTNQVRIETLRSTAPGLELTVSDPIELSYKGRLLSQRSELRIAADLEKLPWLKLKGEFNGALLLQPGDNFPIATLRAAGTKLGGYNIEAEKAQLSATLDWPKLEEFAFRADLSGNALISITGSADLKARSLGNTVLKLQGPVATNLLPAGIHYQDLSFEATVSGTATNLTHAGRFDIRDLETAATQPTHLEGSWQAEQFTFDQLRLRARAGPASLLLAAQGSVQRQRTNLVIKELTLAKGDETYLALSKPATLALLASNRVELSPLRLAGTNRTLAIAGFAQWPAAGELNLAATNINPSLVQSFSKRSLRDFELPQLAMMAHWSNGPLLGRLAGSFSMAQEQLGRVGANVNLELGDHGLALSQMRLWDRSGEVGKAQGFLPLSLNLTHKPLYELFPEEHIDFELRTSTNPVFWNTLGTLANLQLTNPAVTLVVHGTLAQPTADLQAQAQSIQLVRTNQEVPPLGPIEAHITLDEHLLRVRDLAVRVLDQRANVTGSLPLGTNFWSRPREEYLPYALDNASLQVEAPKIELAPFTAYLPKYLSPGGQLSARVAVLPPRNFDGHIEMRGVETRPLPSVGVVQSVRAAIDLKGQSVRIENLSGIIGGERLTLQGGVDLSAASLAKTYPDVDLTIRGNNLPLARNPDIILRSDLNLRVHNGTNQVPIIVGQAVLRDSFLLQDISTLVPGRVAGPTRRPPYFSIEQEPVDDWKLDVQVQGDKFMRVRSPFFQGLVSANFHVVGTAKEPMALGEATINSGRIIFPFAVLDVRQAIVSLTTEDPYLPHVFAVAEGRAFGFDLRMEADGPANAPVVQFSSVPALSSEQIVLMLTTGQIPRDDFSFSNRDRVSKLAFFLGKSVLEKLHPGKNTEEKLSVRSGQDITEQGKQTYEVEYKLSPRWSLVGEYDRFGALNANVKWRLLSK